MSTAAPLIGEQITYRLDLPFPVSANQLWRVGRTLIHTRRGTVLRAPRVYLSAEYCSWLKEADALWMAQKRGRPVMLGRYTLQLTLSSAKRRAIQDGDNLQKAVHDWLQRAELIKNDSLCEAASWQWGEAPTGCFVVLEGTPWVD